MDFERSLRRPLYQGEIYEHFAQHRVFETGACYFAARSAITANSALWDVLIMQGQNHAKER